MKKIMKKIGTSAGIIFNKEEMKILEADVGDLVDLGDIVIIKMKKSKLVVKVSKK